MWKRAFPSQMRLLSAGAGSNRASPGLALPRPVEHPLPLVAPRGLPSGLLAEWMMTPEQFGTAKRSFAGYKSLLRNQASVRTLDPVALPEATVLHPGWSYRSQ